MGNAAVSAKAAAACPEEPVFLLMAGVGKSRYRRRRKTPNIAAGKTALS